MTPEKAIERLVSINSEEIDEKLASVHLLDVFGSFNGLLDAANDDIISTGGIAEETSELLGLIPDIARYIYAEQMPEICDVSSGKLAGEYLKTTYLGKRNELMYMLALDEQGQLIKRILVQEGTLDETTVYMRKIVETVFAEGASVIVLSHNHPGGTIDVSMADCNCTNCVASLLANCGIALADHIIVADGKAHSMAYMQEIPNCNVDVSNDVKSLMRNWNGLDDDYDVEKKVIEQ